MKIIITNLPSFYKINLYNKINEKEKLLVLYTGFDKDERNDDFFNAISSFESIKLKKGVLKQALQVCSIIYNSNYSELIVCGYTQLAFWVSAFISPKVKNSFVIESSYLESKTLGIKGFIKRIIMSRISKVYASGTSQKKLAELIGFKGKIVITKGVGVFNVVPQPAFKRLSEVKKFFYVGRFVEVKNLKNLIEVFNNLPQYQLYLAGFGEQEAELKGLAKENVHIIGSVDNKDLPKYYRNMDVFILPSKSEAWGLVVEEALNNGLPVIVSDSVGCGEEIINESNGLVFKLTDPDGLRNAIIKMTNIEYYNSLRHNISKLDFNKIAEEQVNCYL